LPLQAEVRTMANSTEACLTDTEGGAENTIARSTTDRSYTMLTAVVSDVHFWVPAVVLIGGLFLLRWAS
jgi:hypothetical protein